MGISTIGSDRKRYYPLFLSLDGRSCLVVGGGSVGERKIKRLMEYGARVFLVAEQLTPWLQTQVKRQLLSNLESRYRPDLMEGMTLVFAATSDKMLNRQIAEDARKAGIWCNMATDPEMGDVVLPSIYERGSLCIAFSTGGMAPGVAKIIREQFEKDFGPEWVAALEFLGRLRAAIKNLGLAETDSQRILKGLASLSIQNRIVGGDHNKMIEAVAGVCRPELGAEQIRSLWENSWKQLSSS